MPLLNFFKKKAKTNESKEHMKTSSVQKTKEQVASRKGELGEYKINIQLDQLPKDYRYLTDLIVSNPKASSGYSQIDHVVITPYGIFVIETKNYQGTIYGGRDYKTWLVNGKFKMMNPFVQNYGHIQAFKAFISPNYHNFFISMVSFTKRCTFKVDMEYRQITSNELIVYDIELSEFIHRKVSVLKKLNPKPLLSDQDITTIYTTLLNANISDPKVRKQHTQALMEQNQQKAPKPQPTCVVCKQPVSEKVATYCLANRKFKGNIYCYEHQKNVD